MPGSRGILTSVVRGAALVFTAVVTACGAATSAERECVAGTSAACACTDGRSGAQLCRPDRRFDACVCTDPDDVGPADVFEDVADTMLTAETTGDTSLDAGPPCPMTSELADGPEKLIEVFVTTAGVILVRSDAVLLLGRDGATKKSLVWPREIVSAALDGSTLAVADRGAVTRLTVPALTTVREILVAATCLGGVIISGPRYVCGPARKDRIFYTYDLNTGSLLATSTPYIDGGLEMRRVPGRDEFITVRQPSSPPHELWATDAAGRVVYVNSSSPVWVRDFTFGFHVPADRLITETGDLLKIHPDGCGPWPAKCFAPDGNIGTLKGGQSFLALEDDGANRVYGIIRGDFTVSQPCVPASKCEIQEIDASTRLTLSRKSDVLLAEMQKPVALRLDRMCRRLVFGYVKAASFDYSKAVGHRVVAIDY